MPGEPHVGLEPRRVGRAEVGVEQVRKAEVRAGEARGRAVLVGEHPGANPGLLEENEQLLRAGQQLDVVEHRGVPIRPVDGEGGRLEFRADQALDRHLDAGADGRAHCGEARLWQTEPPHGVGMAPVDGGEMVDQRAIEIKKDGAEAHGPASETTKPGKDTKNKGTENSRAG